MLELEEGSQEGEGNGESGRRWDQKGRQGREDSVTTHEGTSRSAWHTASTQEMVVILGVIGTSFFPPGQWGGGGCAWWGQREGINQYNNSLEQLPQPVSAEAPGQAELCPSFQWTEPQGHTRPRDPQQRGRVSGWT